MTDFDDIGGPINRPANNARRSTPGEALGNEHTLDAGATDFLGLNHDLGHAPQDPLQDAPPPSAAQGLAQVAPQPFAMEQAPAAQSWLLEMPHEPAPDVAQAVQLAADELAPAGPELVPAAHEASSLLNTAWQEGERRRSKARWMVPVAGGAALAALALVGYPRFIKDRTPAAVDPAGTQPHATVSDPSPLPSAAVAPDAADVGPAEAPDLAPVEPLEPGYEPLDVVREPEYAASTPPAIEEESTLASEREEVLRAPRTALEENGLVEVVDPARAKDIHGECGDSAEGWWSPLEVGSASDQVAAAAAEEPAPTDALALAKPETLASAEAEPASNSTPPSAADANPARGERGRKSERRGRVARPEAEPQPESGAEAAIASTALEPRVAPADPLESEPEARDTFQPATAEPSASPEPERAAPSATELEPLPVPTELSTPLASESAPTLVADPRPPSVLAPGLAPLAPSFVGAPWFADAPSWVTPVSVGPLAPESTWIALEPTVAAQCSGNERVTALSIDTVLLLDHVDGVARASRLGGPTIVSDDAIPFGSISSKTKVLTPTVGKVRAVLQTGEIFEGSLYAVGEDSLWIDTSFGRMGLAASRVRSVVRIDPAKGAPALGAAGSQNSAGLERVRIKTPGGTLYGKVIERVGDTATVITDEGARLTLPAKDVERLAEAPKVRIGGN
ncbi:MAG: hypothetical protein IT454_22715 [Planctomycetes bacterium]|nr:hypothetical protein [Planctomycetota bacterium]